ncbi:MAG: hypothetical protein C4525_01570 [Desulfarculus sp.]|nr:MAG: hypothetical protein C4525_01570 [Desulfarculus sp.]
MKNDPLQKAHLLYDLEGENLERLLQQDPTYAGLLERLQRRERALAGRDQQAAEALAAARCLLLEITRETCFKMGYLLAHNYPLEQAYKL